MAAKAFVIFAADGPWRIGMGESGEVTFLDLSASEDRDLSQVAASVVQTLELYGYEGQGVILAIPSSWCLCASINTEGLPRKNSRAAMIYRLEEKLPLAAEEIVVDFIDVEGQALGVSVQTTKVNPIVESLEQAGIAVQLICPTALLALQDRLTVDDEAAECDAMVWGNGDHIDLFCLANRIPTAWHLLTNNPNDLLTHLRIAAIGKGEPLHVQANNLEDTVIDRLKSSPDCQVELTDRTPIEEAAVHVADRMLQGQFSVWINLRQDALAVHDPIRHVRKPLTAAIVAGLVFLASLCGAMAWRAAQYDRMASRHATEQQTIFKEMFPDQVVPINVKSRFVSEHRRLANLRGESSGIQFNTSSLLILRDVLTRLPRGIRYRILEMRLGGERLYIEGQTRSHSDADTITASLNKNEYFDIEPPRTEKLADKGVGFTIIGVAGIEKKDR